MGIRQLRRSTTIKRMHDRLRYPRELADCKCLIAFAVAEVVSSGFAQDSDSIILTFQYERPNRAGLALPKLRL
jgi:hypothetical protein